MFFWSLKCRWVKVTLYYKTWSTHQVVSDILWVEKNDIGVADLMETFTHHDDVIKWNHFPRYRPFVRGIHRSLVDSPWQRPLTRSFSLICAWINGWAINRDAGDLRRHCSHYDVTVMTVQWRYEGLYSSSGKTIKSREVSKPRDWVLKLSHRLDIWHAIEQHCCRDAGQISERSYNSKTHIPCFEISWQDCLSV